MSPSRRLRIRFPFLLLTISLLVTTPGVALLGAAEHREKDDTHHEPPSPAAHAVLWRDPGPVESLDLFYGPGGREHAPDPEGTYTFVQEITNGRKNGRSPKFDVRDEHGVEWRVKLGHEPQSETAATRLLWAAGYLADEDYYLPEFKVTGLTTLRHGRKWVSKDGTVRNARLERRRKHGRSEEWSWFDNPFLGTKELNGLRVMMALLNNWDLKTQNNSVIDVGDERHYLVSDMGCTFGKTGNEFTRSVSKVEDYSRSPFIESTTPETVDFVMHSRPSFILAVAVPYYRDRTRMERIAQDIPRADARWIGQRLGRLSRRQIEDSFRAAGYTDEEVDRYTAVVQERIAALTAL